MLAKKPILASRSLAIIANRAFSSEIDRIVKIHEKNFPNAATYALKRGTGNRASFNGTVVTVFGAGGNFGRSLIPALARIGCQIIVPYRKELSDVQGLKVHGDLGQIHFVPFYLKNEESIQNSIKHSNVVINIMNRWSETVNFSFYDLNVKGAQLIAKIAKQNNVTRFVHFSSLNADPAPVGHMIRKGSEFLRTKYEGELAVREEFPEAIIFRPARMFGLIDNFFHFYMNEKNYSLRRMPLWNKGYGIYKQPVCMNDVSKGVINAIYDNECVGKTVDAVGPRRYELNELVKFFMRSVGRGEKDDHFICELRTFLYYILKTRFVESTFKYPLRTMEMLETECLSDKLTPDNLTLEDLGVKLSYVEDEYHPISRVHTMNLRIERLVEMDEPPLPKYV